MGNKNWKVFFSVLILAIIALVLIINTTPSNDWLWISLLGFIVFFIGKELITYAKKRKILNLIIAVLYITIFGLIFFYFYYGKLLIVN